MGWTTDTDAKFKLVSDIVEKFPNYFQEARIRLQQLKSSTSKFEWVDSVLVQAV